MSDDARRAHGAPPERDLSEPEGLGRRWLLCFAAVLALILGAPLDVAIVALPVLLVLAPPAGVRLRWDFWRPGRLWPAVLVYVPFALVWVAFATGYLRVAEAIGARVEPQPQLVEVANHQLAAGAFWLAVLRITVFAPVCEEIVFRGYLFGALLGTMPTWAVQLLTAALFGAVHGSGHAVPIAVLSLLFGYLRQRYRSLWPAILAHMLHNAVTLFVVCSWPELLDLFYNR